MVAAAVAVGLADVHREPDASAELVTQALMNMPVVIGQQVGAWTHVTLPDYEGWMLSAELDEPPVKGFCKVGEYCATPLDLAAVVTATHTSLYAQAVGDEIVEMLYLSTSLPLLDTTRTERLQVALPGERSGWLAKDAAAVRQHEALYPQMSIATVTAYARAFLAIPYLWGGTSWQGIDCSGFVQLCYRMAGTIIPRDADQQYAALSGEVEREAMREGDLVFFGRTQITHVALALNNTEYIHAEGQRYNRVTINSFDPLSAHYDQRLAELVWGLKRAI